MKDMLYQNILHIDSDIDNHETFYHALREVSSTSTYHAFTDAREAFYTLISKKLKPDVIFLDLDLPGKSGQAFLASIKKREELRYIPVVILSASTRKSKIDLSQILGARAFIKKPYIKGVFTKMLSSILTFDFLINSRLEFPVLDSDWHAKDTPCQVPEEIFSKAVTEKGFNLN